MVNYLPGSLISQFKTALNSKFVSNATTIKELTRTELAKVQGEYSLFQFPFSNESLSESKIVFDNTISLK